MKLLICILAVAAVSQADIDFDKYKPTSLYVPVNGTPAINALNQTRIVGGKEAQPHQFPYQAALLIETPAGSFFCGGSLISTSYVLTAAHCVDSATSVQVILGAHRFRNNEPGQVRMRSRVTKVHEQWDSQELVNDIAYVKLPSPVKLTETIQLVKLPTRRDQDNLFVGSQATISGWGKDSDYAPGISEVLRFVQTPIITNKECNKDYYNSVRETNICADGSELKSSCNGDSGGPLVNSDKKQLGIVSFGRRDGCEKRFASVYTRVTSYLDWIEQNTDVVIRNAANPMNFSLVLMYFTVILCVKNIL